MARNESIINMITQEGDIYEVPIEIARMSNLVKESLEEDDGSNDVLNVPLQNVSSHILMKVIAFGHHYLQEPMTPIQTPFRSSRIEELVQPWYVEFVRVPQLMLFELVAAANFMDIEPLLDLTCLAVSILIKGRSPEELREMFHISDEYSKEEESEIEEENQWTHRPPNTEQR